MDVGARSKRRRASRSSRRGHEPRATTSLTTDALLCVLERLPPNEVACTARLLCKEVAKALSAPQHRTVRLSQPIPARSVAWRCGEDAVRQLTFKGKLGALSTAAASGCEANLVVALWLLRRTFFPGMGKLYLHRYHDDFPDPGTAAASAGHAHMLPRLLARGCPLEPDRVLEAVAEHGDLPGLQRAWALLRPLIPHGMGTMSAARSRCHDPLPKVRWLVDEMGLPVDSCTAAGAMCAGGDLPLLEWVCGRGASLNFRPLSHALSVAIEESSMGVVEWTWAQLQLRHQQRHGGAPTAGLLQVLSQYDAADCVQSAATSGVEGVAKLRWLQERGADVARYCHCVLRYAAMHGRLETVRYLVEECGADVGWEVIRSWPSNPRWTLPPGDPIKVVQYLLQRGAALKPEVVLESALGNLGHVLWLVGEGGFPFRGTQAAHALVRDWPGLSVSARAEEECLAAVQAVLGAGAVADSELVEEAAERGSLPLVRWLVAERGCELSRDVLASAAEGGSAAVIEWLVARGCPTSARVGAEYLLPAQQGDRATLELLLQLRVPRDGGALLASELGQLKLPVLQWLVDNGWELNLGQVLQAGAAAESAERRAWFEALAARMDLAGAD